MVNRIKASSKAVIEKENLFPNFTEWQEDYLAITGAYKDKNAMSKYIEQQHDFHREVSFQDEYAAMLKAAELK